MTYFSIAYRTDISTVDFGIHRENIPRASMAIIPDRSVGKLWHHTCEILTSQSATRCRQ